MKEIFDIRAAGRVPEVDLRHDEAGFFVGMATDQGLSGVRGHFPDKETLVGRLVRMAQRRQGIRALIVNSPEPPLN